MMDNDRQIAAADFKANCLRLMEEVARERRPITITKRGKPVAKLVPAEQEPSIYSATWRERPRFVATSSVRSTTSNGPAMPKTSEERPLLLDTHVWIWFMLASSELTVGSRTAINHAAGSGRPRFAAISVWEAALLGSRGRITLGGPLAQWITAAVSAPGLSIEPSLPEIAVEACRLPDAFHRDPVDQMIVATARVVNAALMTRDRQILDYAARGHLPAIAA
jgi:prevent-host-death family protein